MSRHFQGKDTLIARVNLWRYLVHYNDVIMSAMASLITSVSIACLTVCSGGDQRKHQTPRHWPLCGEFTGDRGIQKASNTENVSISWRHHESRSTIILYGGDMETCLLAPTAGSMPIMSRSGQGATPVRGAPGWLPLNPVGGMREPPSGSMQLQKLQFQSAIYGNPEHSNWHQSFPTHIWLFLAQCGMLAGFTKTMQAE